MKQTLSYYVLYVSYLAKTKTFGRSWPLQIVYLGHFTFKKSDILKSDRFLSCQTNKFSAKVAGLWR